MGAVENNPKKDGLWIISAAGLWTLPIIVLWQGDDVAIVRFGAGLPLLRNQLACLTEVLQPWEVQGQTWCNALPLLKYGRHVPDQDPELLVRWDPFKVEVSDNPRLDFIKYMCRGSLMSEAHAGHWFALFCREAVRWILCERKVLDLGFCKLGLIRCKPSWHAELADACNVIDNDVLKEFLSQLDTYRLDNEGLCAGRLEVSTGTIFSKNLNRLERQRAELHVDYWGSIANEINETIAWYIETHRSYLHQDRRETVKPDDCRAEGFTELPVCGGTMDSDSSSSQGLPSIPADVDVHETKCSIEDLDLKAAGMSGLCDF